MDLSRTSTRGRRNLILGCVGCAGLGVAFVTLVLLSVSALFSWLDSEANARNLRELHARVLEVEADEADRERVLERLESLREQGRPRGWTTRWLSRDSLESMRRVLRDGYLSPPEARFLERELDHLARPRR